MGTNYYVDQEPPCPTCGHVKDRLQIGKSSGGWKFLFAPYPELGLTSYRAWLDFLPGKTILSEYEEEISLDEFTTLVATKQTPNSLDAKNAFVSQYGPAGGREQYETADPDGYRFSTTNDFS